MHLQGRSFTDLMISQPPGGLFLQQSLPPSFLSLISLDNTNVNKTLRFVGRRRRGCFLSVSLSIKEGNEGYVGESREIWGQNGNAARICRQEEDDDQTASFQVENVREKESGAFNTAKHLFAGAIAAAVSRFLLFGFSFFFKLLPFFFSFCLIKICLIV